MQPRFTVLEQMALYQLVLSEDGTNVTLGEHRSPFMRRDRAGNRLDHEGRTLQVVRVESAAAPYLQRLVCRDADEANEWTRMPEEVAIEVTGRAATRVLAKGGRLYLWEEKTRGEWQVDKAAFHVPPAEDVTFEVLQFAGIQILIADDLGLPARLSISRSLIPPLKLHVEWDGQPWGGRGTALGDPPGTYG